MNNNGTTQELRHHFKWCATQTGTEEEMKKTTHTPIHRYIYFNTHSEHFVMYYYKKIYKDER